MSNYFKIEIFLFYLFLLFSYIKNKELLDEWENNTYSIELVKPPLSLVVNNLTNTTLYLYKEGIYLIDENNNRVTIENNLINSIDSPLIVYNDSYYICSSSGLFQIVNKKLKRVDIPINANTKNLKCFYYKNGQDNYILIGMIGDNYLLNYNLKKQTYVAKNIAKNLIDINSINIDTSIPNFVTISKDNNNKYMLEVFKYENGDYVSGHQMNLSYYSDFKTSNELNITISFLREQMIIIFTYIPDKEFNFYHVNYGSNEIKLVGGKNLLRSFNEYNLSSATFIENTPIIYYIINKNRRYYLGVADLQYFVILYNIEIPKNYNIFYEQGYYYQSKGFLNYFDNLNQKKICPFVSNSTLCQHKLENKYFVISKEYSSYGLYKNYFSDFCSNGETIGPYCLENCPIYSVFSGQGSCSICQYNYYFNYADKQCSAECEYKSDNKICYDCERKNKLYYNNDCINNCSEVFKLYNKEKKSCVSCENNKYFDTSTNNTCLDKCPENYEIDEENKACIHCKDFNMYSLKNSDGTFCYKKCPFFYYADKDSYECILCKSGLYYKNGECVQSCGKEYVIKKAEINKNTIDYCFSCKDIGRVAFDNICYESCANNLYEENGSCVEECNEGFIKNTDTKKCESCLEKGLYYYKDEKDNKECKKKCSDFKTNLAWDEKDHICKDCNYYLEDNKCVSQCKENAKIITIDKVCFTCPDYVKYYSSGFCYSKCPENTVPNKLEDYCSYCSDDRIFFKNKCIKECKAPYIKNITLDNHYICQKCEKGKYYTSGKCKEQCNDNYYKLDEDQSCHLCFCNEKGHCNSDINECDCDTIDNENYFGKNCEFSRKVKDNMELKINPIYNKALKTNVSFYNFNVYREGFTNYKIKWEFYLGTKEITSEPEYRKYFITGNKEEIFGINPNLLSEDKYNYLHLTLINDNNDILEDEIRIYVHNIEIISEHKANFLDPRLQDSGFRENAMNTKIEIEQTDYSNLNLLKYYYKFSFLDGNNEEIPLTNFINEDSIETYYIPFAKQYLVTIKNDRGEIKQYEIKKDDSDIYKSYNNDDFSSKSIEVIKSDSNYNDIEKLFIFMLIFNYKGKVLNNDELEEIFNYIDNNYEKFINGKGYYNIDNDNDNDNQKIIYYSEPKLLFALINSIIISQKKILNNSNIKVIYNSLNKCVNMLQHKNIKLSSKDIISLLRTIEQLHIVYNEFIEKQNSNDEDSLNFNNLFEKITNYLSLKLLPGEGIKIVGNRTILFSYNLGVYQNLLAISSKKLTSPANISNINTYSYEDYGLNEEDCGKRGEAFLCMDKEIYNNIKNKIQLKGHNIKNISLNIYIVNNIKNSEKKDINETNNENDNYIVSLQFYDLNNKNKIDLTLDDNNFYSLEFNYKNEKKKINSAKINDKNSKFYVPYNYSNFVCYPKNHIKNSSYYCFTYFDYFKHIIQCKCNILDEITIVENKELSDFYKKIQFNTFYYTYTNNITRHFIITFLLLLLIPGLLFLLYDICKINKYMNRIYVGIKEKRREYYNEVKNYTNSKLKFPIYSTFNKFPYCAAFIANNYTSPKYIKHLIVITALLLGFILNLIPFYFTIPFEEKQILIDKRDINIDDSEIHSIAIIGKYLRNGLIYALISLIVVHLFIKLFNKILNIDKKNIKYWKNIKDIFKDYVYFEIKKNIYLGKNFARIKGRMKAFYSICGRYLLNKNIMNHPERDKKLENYLKYTGKLSKKNKLITSNKIQIKDDSKLKDNKIGTDKESLLYELPENNYSINDENTLMKSEYKPPKININIKVNIPVDKNLLVSSSFGIKQNNKVGDILKNLKIMKSDNFQIGYIRNNKFGITNNTIERLEKIKNKYIYISKSRSKSNIIPKNTNNKSPLSIYYNNNLSIIKVEDYKECEKKDDSGETKKEFKLLILMTLVLGLIFFVLIISSIAIIQKLLNEYEYFMVKIWLLCTILILFVAYFLLYFIKTIIGSILLFNFYPKRKSGCFIKFMFKIFVDKNLIYMFKIRNYITKYRSDFINI